MTKPQREALARVNAAVPMATVEEYDEMSPLAREKVRSGFDADGAPVIKLQPVMVRFSVAKALLSLGLVSVTFSHRKQYAYLIPKS
jgi:hypothetical protein